MPGADALRQEFGGWLASMRERQGITQQQMADRVGITRVQLARWEAGASLPRREVIPAISQAYGADLAETYERAGYAPGSRTDLGPWAEAVARRIERRASVLAPERRRALERAIDSLLAAAA